MPTCTTHYTEELVTAWLGLHFSDVRRGKQVTLPVLSGSMAPLLVPGGTVRIEQTSWRACRPGDIVVFREDGHLTAHRLLYALCLRGRWYLYQKGDANEYGSWLKAEQVVGVAVEARSADGARVEFRTARARRRQKARVPRQLVRDLWSRLLALARRARSWLQTKIRGAGYA